MNAPLPDDKHVWSNEPDTEFWIDPETGYGCRIVRHTRMKHLCGYVGVPFVHPWANKGYDDMRMADNGWVDVHGGLTYASDHAPNEQPDGHWWFGFDCAHCGDLVPHMAERYGETFDREETYKDWAYVKAETTKLARQAKQTESAMAIAP